MRKKCPSGLFLILGLIGLTLILSGAKPLEMNPDKSAARPLADWIWLGSAITEEDITWNLENFKEMGIGGVTILPMYGVKGEEDRQIPFLSPEWVHMLKFTADEAKRLGLSLDMNEGSGWPYGGPNVPKDDVAWKTVLYNVDVKGLDFSEWLKERTDRGETLVGFSVYRPDGKRTITRMGTDALSGPENKGDGTLIALFKTPTGMQVKRPAPGGAGPVIDYYSREAFHHYNEYFKKRFDAGGIERGDIRAFFNDSFENYGSNWSDELPDLFRSRRGYDLMEHLDAFESRDTEEGKRVYADYLETLSDLLYEAIYSWNDELESMGIATCYQAHGSPGNILDLYAISEIPETETFGSCAFKIPGYRYDLDYPETSGRPDLFMMKFSTSAAHIAGRKLVNSETGTWISEHFKSTLAMLKPEIDLLMLAGVNQIAYKSELQSKMATFPGNIVYCSIHMTVFNHFWDSFHLLNNYVTNCLNILQNSDPDNDVLLYFPIHDIWYGMKAPYLFTVHDARNWLHQKPLGRVAKELQEEGYGFDYVSDRMIQNDLLCVDDEGDGKRIGCRNSRSRYRAILVPECRMMPPETLRRLTELAKEGVPVLFEKGIPEDVPGYYALEKRRHEMSELKKRLEKEDSVVSDAGEDGKVVETLRNWEIPSEGMATMGLTFLRKTDGESTYYFITNLSDQFYEGWIPIAKSGESITIYDPISGNEGNVSRRESSENGKTEIYLDLHPGASCFVRTCDDTEPSFPDWRYVKRDEKDGFSIGDGWRLTPITGEPELPDPITMDKLTSWTDSSDERYRYFSGTVRYSRSFAFDKDRYPAGIDGLELVFDDICELATVRVNGETIGTVWSLPNRLFIPVSVLKAENEIEIDVVNAEFNRIIDLEKRGIEWKKFEDCNVVNIKYQPFDASSAEPIPSGLIGDIRLIPCEFSAP